MQKLYHIFLDNINILIIFLKEYIKNKKINKQCLKKVNKSR